MQDETEDGMRPMQMQSTDAGAVLRFLDIYEHMAAAPSSLRFPGRRTER